MQKLLAALLSAVVLLLGTLLFRGARMETVPAFRTPYQAVVLTGGQVYYGKLENMSGMYPVLRDVYYVATRENPQTKQVATMLVRRGKELHRPDFMVLNRQSILFVEPVSGDSEIARSIAEQKKTGQ